MGRDVKRSHDTPPDTLFREETPQRTGPIATVAPIAGLDRVYSYAVPPALVDAVRPGVRVEVPFGRKGTPRVGFCVEVSHGAWPTTLRPVHGVIDAGPLLSAELLALGQWMSEYYVAPLGKTLEAMVPAAARRQSGFRRVRRIVLAPPPERTSDIRLTPKRQALLDQLEHGGGAVDWDALRQGGASSAALAALRDAGWVRDEIVREPVAAPRLDIPRSEPDFTLNDDQQAAVHAIESWLEPSSFRVGLLYGVAGSGKTEVYVHAIRRALAMGRQAILLLPEIALTAQTMQRLAARFADVAVLHSDLTDVHRSRIWAEIAQGRLSVVIGTRSAVFAPCPRLGVIVVDEEQEPSYKNQQVPRFHTRDVAVKRAQLAGVPVLLGSATPSLESWANCRRLEHYVCLHLPHRVRGLDMPQVEVVDMTAEHRVRPGIHLLSRLAEQRLGETLERGEQAVLLLNRRGYASYLFCPKCHQRIVCPSCAANLVFHKATGMAQCHYCRARVPVPDQCTNENCRHRLVHFGMGTQRVEEELARKFASARVARVDSDTMRHAEQYERVLGAFARRETDVLVGTQIIAKGLDFPYVSFVGVICADTAMAVPDFRASERTFQLVTQVAGRAGRAQTAGRVVVQTFLGETPALRSALAHDYDTFAQGELRSRQRLRLPPYGRLVRFVVADPRMSAARGAADALAQCVQRTAQAQGLAIECWGPNACPMARLRDLHRFELVVRADTARPLQEAMKLLRHDAAFRPKVRQFTIDVDPVALL